MSTSTVQPCQPPATFRVTSYPTVLNDLLSRRYTTQTIEVINRGCGGEKTVDGLLRLIADLNQTAPQALLLLEGANDLNQGDASTIPDLIGALTTMVRTARSRGVAVLLGTLLPQRIGGSRAGAALLIQPANNQIRAMAASEGAILVDLYQDFGGEPGIFIDDDGLHPTPAGYQRIANSFLTTIRSRFEVPTTTLMPWWRR